MMWRFLAGGLSALLLVAAGFFLFGSGAASDDPLPAAPAQVAADGTPLPATAPEATAQTREQKRFGRYDKDRNGAITRDEYLASRRKAYAKLDANHDGTLSFEEWAIATTDKFMKADGDHSGAMNAAEFATTAVKTKPKPQPKCPPTDVKS